MPANGPAPPAPLPPLSATPKALAERAPPRAPAQLAGRARIQLAAFSDEARAKEASLRLSNAVDELFIGLRFDIEGVAAKTPTGRLYRVQAGPFADINAARSACQRLRARGQTCFPVAG